ncbi:kinase suppressor of Ras 1 [Clonorchis sinensis]|uniref:Kinase suppressor of Ras 1 n=1 Tax=Clonorchis sinensis TaxID=79923 RepID=G7YLG5_CLOSI|nr:kinase suppressor of Ras 1 [Clonorchis sinensis]
MECALMDKFIPDVPYGPEEESSYRVWDGGGKGVCSADFQIEEFELTVLELRGEWHGEVMVHLFDSLTREERIRFWQDVMRLTMTRHENIALFMGACAEPPNFAIVTSACNGISLYKKLHVQHEKIPRRFPFQILRQVVHAMEYLHSRIKPIIIRHLTSRNIFLQPKVVLSLTDYASMECPYQTCVPISPDCVRYVAPELFRLHLFSKREFCKNVSKPINRPQPEVFLSRLQQTTVDQTHQTTTDREPLGESLSESESSTRGSTHPEIRKKRLPLSKPPSTEDENVGGQTTHNQVAENLRPSNNRPKKKRFTWNSTLYFRDSAFDETTDIYAFG